MNNKENNQKEEDGQKKTVYKETEERIDEKQKDNGETSSAADMGRTDLINRPDREHKPLGSSHEPGTTPGSDL